MKPDYKNPTYQPPVGGMWIPIFMLMMISCEALPLTQGTGYNKGDKPTKEWCEDAGFKNYGQCVKEWAQENLDPNPENIIWDGGYETGNFLQWHMSDVTMNQFSQIPTYGRPTQEEGGGDNPAGYFGDGSLLRLVTSPVRVGEYAAEFTVKNSQNGVEPDDCDVPFPTCSRRRTELTMQLGLPDVYDGLPYMGERWLSFSVYFPNDWDTDGSGWGPTVFQLKPRNENGASGGMMALELNGANWTFWHRWNDVENDQNINWQQQMFYSGDDSGSCYPRTTDPHPWADGVQHFPDKDTSCAALQSLNIGGWTDWVFHVKFDARGAGDDGTGFMRVWKREDKGPWVQVLDIFPGEVTRGGETFDMGIGYNSPPTESNNGGFGIKSGMYGAKGQFWDLPANRVLIHDNIKIGSENARFVDMSPDGSMP